MVRPARPKLMCSYPLLFALLALSTPCFSGSDADCHPGFRQHAGSSVTLSPEVEHSGGVEFYDAGGELSDEVAEMRVDGSGVVITGTYQISSGMRVTISTNDHLVKELTLLKQLRDHTQGLIEQHQAQVRRYTARITSIERGEGIIDMAYHPEGDDGAGDGAGDGSDTGGSSSPHAGAGGWMIRDIEKKEKANETNAQPPDGEEPQQQHRQGQGDDSAVAEQREVGAHGEEGAPESSDLSSRGPIVELTPPPHAIDSDATETVVRTLTNGTGAPNCSRLHAEAYAVAEFSAFAVDYDRKELLRFEHHVHPDVRAIHVTHDGGGLLFAGLTKSLEGMCTGETREIIIPPDRGFRHAQFDENPAEDFPVGRDRTVIIRITLLQYSSLDEHVRKIRSLEGMINGLKSQVDTVAKLQSDYEGKARQKSAQERFNEEQQRDHLRQKQQYEDQLNYGVLLIGICVVAWRYRQNRMANRAKIQRQKALAKATARDQ